jgi:uncharacterized protein YlxW (UPF0749 family)
MTEQPKSRHSAPLRRESWKQRVEAAWSRRARTRDRRSLAWRLLVPLVFLLAGALFVTSSFSADGTDLRAGRYGDLGSLVAQQKEETDALRAQVRQLTDEVNELSAQVADNRVQEVQAKADALMRPAGMVAVSGPGLTVTLDDAPEEVIESAENIEVGALVVHQQDIQAVVNALWAGGAEAMTLQGQRIISTTGIKCVGNTVRLHGVPYAPPYVITAVGDPDAMLTSVNENPYIGFYKEVVERYQLGYEVEAHTEVQLPGYEGSLDLDYARPAGDEASRPEDSDI